MYAKHVEELQVLHTNQISEFIFRFNSPYYIYTQIEDDYRILKLYTPDILTEPYVHYMDIYNGQTISLKVQIDAEHDGKCKASHNSWRKVHHMITKVEFEYFGSVGIALFYICSAGIYLSVANLKNRTIQIDFGNRVLVDARCGFCGIQLLKIDDQTGVAVHDHNSKIHGPGGQTFETFRLTDAGKIQILLTRYVPHGIAFRVVPLMLHTHLHYFTIYGTLIDYNYISGTSHFERKLIPPLKASSPDVWYDSKFYFMCSLDFEQHKLGVFDMNTKRYSILQLPENIPLAWMQSILVMDESRQKECKHVAPVGESTPCPMTLLRIPLRVPETLSNLTYFALLKKPRSLQQKLEPLVQTLCPSLRQY